MNYLLLKNPKSIKLAASMLVCGISLSMALATTVQKFIDLQAQEMQNHRGKIELMIAQPFFVLKNFKFNKNKMESTAHAEKNINAAAPATKKITAAKRATQIVAVVKSQPQALSTPAKAPTVVNAQAYPVAAQRSAVKYPSARNQSKNYRKSMGALIDIAEYLTGDALGVREPEYVDQRGLLVMNEKTTKIRVPELEFAWEQLVRDADKQIDRAVTIASLDEYPKAEEKAPVDSLEAKKIIPPPLKPRQVIAATAAKEVDIQPIQQEEERLLRDRVSNLSAAISHDLVNTPRMGIQEEELALEAPKQSNPTAAKKLEQYQAKNAETQEFLEQINISAPADSSAPANIKTNIVLAQANPAPSESPSQNLNSHPVVRTANRLPSQTKPAPFVNIIGKLAEAANGYPGHFEIGFYRAVSPAGIPIGAPLVQSILKATQLSFNMSVPRSAKGYVFARFVSADRKFAQSEWHGYPNALDLPDILGTDIFITIPINNSNLENAALNAAVKAAITQTLVVSGRVGAMFAEKGQFLALSGARISLRGTKNATTSDKDGRFSLSLPGVAGRALLEVVKPGYLPRVQEIQLGKKRDGNLNITDVLLANREAIRHMAQSLGLNQSNASSVLIVEAKNKSGDGGLPGISAQSTLKTQGPFYFSEKGFPQVGLKSTTLDGRMIFFNVEPGVGFLETAVLGEAVSPFVVSALGAGELMLQTLDFFEGETKISGKLYDPISAKNGEPAPINGAKVKLAGSSDWTETDSFGNFELPNGRFTKGTEVLIDVSKAGYYNHRFAYKLPAEKNSISELQLYAFPQQYINKLATSVEIQLDPNFGMLMGKVGGEDRLRVDTLMDRDGDNQARDYYFDSKNVIQGSHALTDPHFGTYMVFNANPGRALLQAHNSGGELRYSDMAYFSPSTITVVVSE